MSKEVEFFVSPLFVRSSDKVIFLGSGARPLRLRDFQYSIYQLLSDRESKDLILVRAPTGAGKTLSLLIPLFVNLESSWFYNGAVGVYPSRELAKDQMDSISNILLELGAREKDITSIFDELKPLDNQARSRIEDLIRVFEIEVTSTAGNVSRRIPIVLILITSYSLEVLRNIISINDQEKKSNREVLKYILGKTANQAYTIVFTVPEYPYLLTTGGYQEFHKSGAWLHRTLTELSRFLKYLESSAKINYLGKLEEKLLNLQKEFGITREKVREFQEAFLLFRQPVFLDEFHLYSGSSLSSFLALLYIYVHQGGIGKIVLSSATPQKEVLIKSSEKGERRRVSILEIVIELARLSGYAVHEVSACATSSLPQSNELYDQVRKKTHVKIVSIVLTKGRNVIGPAAYGVIQRYVPEVLEHGGWLEDFKRKGRSMIIVDRVASVYECAEKVRELTGKNPTIIASGRRLFNTTITTDLKKEDLIVGNMAIAFGIDIRGMDLGVVVAKDHLSALQKIGRIGRGQGEDIAIVYIPIPGYKRRSLEKHFKQLEGKEISYEDFIELLRKLYPKPALDMLFRESFNIIRALIPVWSYTLLGLVGERSEVLDELHNARSASDVRYLREFVAFLTLLKHILEDEKLYKRLRRFILTRISLTPVGLHSFFSYRNIIGVPIKNPDNDLEDVIDLPTAGRNFPLKLENGELILRPVDGRLYEYTFLRLKVVSDRERIRRLFQDLHGRIVTLQLIAMLIGRNVSVYQGDRMLSSTLLSLLGVRDLRDTPIMVLAAKSESLEKRIEYLSATDTMIPVYADNKSAFEELVGGLFFL